MIHSIKQLLLGLVLLSTCAGMHAMDDSFITWQKGIHEVPDYRLQEELTNIESKLKEREKKIDFDKRKTDPELQSLRKQRDYVEGKLGIEYDWEQELWENI